MSDDAQPKFDWGRRVRATVDLFNDGSFTIKSRRLYWSKLAIPARS